jgi:hypothetical protein
MFVLAYDDSDRCLIRMQIRPMRICANDPPVDSPQLPKSIDHLLWVLDAEIGAHLQESGREAVPGEHCNELLGFPVVFEGDRLDLRDSEFPGHRRYSRATDLRDEVLSIVSRILY